MRPKKAAERKPEVVEGADKKKRKAATLRVMMHMRGTRNDDVVKSGILDESKCILPMVDFSRERRRVAGGR